MCRSIKPLFNYNPPATDEQVQAAALQFVRKISGYTRPSRANEEAFHEAVAQIATASSALLTALQTSAPPRDRAQEVRRSVSRP